MRASIFAALAALATASIAFAEPGAAPDAPAASTQPASVKTATPSKTDRDATSGNAPYIAGPPDAKPSEAMAADQTIAAPGSASLTSAGVSPAATTITGGDLGTLSMPALALPAPRLLTLGIGFDYYRGGDFLLPGATLQRSAMSLGAAYAPLAWLETYGALGFSDANRFGPSSRQTLTSIGDADLGVKVVLPRIGILSAGGLLELDIPSGVGGFSLKGTGGRAAAMAALSGELGPVPLVGTFLAGYVLDDTYKLLGSIGTFPAYALGLSLYDRVQGEVSLQSPLRWAAPAVELQIESPVARGQELPSGGQPLRARLLFGATAIHTGVPGLTASAGLCFSLTRTGRPDPDSLPLQGWAPDSPWRALVGFSYSFEPKLPERKMPEWHQAPEIFPPPPQQPARAPLLGQPVGNGLGSTTGPSAFIAATPIPEGKGRVSLLVLDSRTQTPVSGAWVNAVELSDLSAVSGTDGRANVDAPPGQLTLAIAHDGYDPYSEGAVVTAGTVRELVVQLQPQLNDATVRGRIIDANGEPLRASIELVPLGGGGPPPASLELPTFEGTFTLATPHGMFNLIAHAPGYSIAPVRVEVLPGELVSRDLLLRRVPGEPLARATPLRIDFSSHIAFVPQHDQLLPISTDALAELAKVMQLAGGPMKLGVRVDASEMNPGEDELTILLLAEQRASAVADALVAHGMRRALLQANGLGIAREGQPLIEIKRVEAPGKPSL